MIAIKKDDWISIKEAEPLMYDGVLAFLETKDNPDMFWISVVYRNKHGYQYRDGTPIEYYAVITHWCKVSIEKPANDKEAN